MQELLIVFKAFSDETRLRILKLLEHGELCVCDIFSALDMVQPKISFHLSALKDAGLITDRKEGRWVRYSIAADCDLFRRYMIATTLEKIPADAVAEDLARLNAFLKQKNEPALTILRKAGSAA
jgi:ArsR family transcriptional regulator, arsenate/arsenite/antimonite-responsive transcriptional repressor